MQNIEQNYISIVIVERNAQEIIEEKLRAIETVLKNNFKNFEVIVVDNMSTDNTLEVLSKCEIGLTVVSLPRRHGEQQALNAGVHAAIGDYIVEISDISMDLNYNKIIELYQKSQEGYDFVFLSPANINYTSKRFYKILNKNFKNELSGDISSSVMILSSRRGQNKISEIGTRVINRNVMYAISGLKSAAIKIDIKYKNKRNLFESIELMVDTLIYHTNVITNFAQGVSLIFFCFSILTIIYSFVMKISGIAIVGWASTIIFISLGFSAIFLMFSVLARYMHHILQNTLQGKDYVYRSITKKSRI